MRENKLYVNIDRIHNLMKEKGMDISKLSKLSDISLYRIKRLLSGADQTHLPSDIILRLAIALNISTDSLIIY